MNQWSLILGSLAMLLSSICLINLRFGHKIWCLNLEGYLHHFDVYQRFTKSIHQEFWMWPRCCAWIIRFSGVYIDNYFISLNLLKHLATKGIGCIGTLRPNMLQDCPANVNSFVKKQNKGYYDKKSNVVVCRWNDNGPVTAASNFEQVEPLDSARRWDKKKKTYINVPRPRMISLYNRYMGNTDVMDQSLACYHPLVRNKK